MMEREVTQKKDPALSLVGDKLVKLSALVQRDQCKIKLTVSAGSFVSRLAKRLGFIYQDVFGRYLTGEVP